MNFCHITPTRYLDIFASGRKTHLLLAHLVEEDKSYREWYANEKKNNNCQIILDNSAFEMFSRGLSMYDSSKLVNLAKEVNADYIVMSDYPGEKSRHTINKAIETHAEIRANRFKTFFCPQSEPGNIDDLTNEFILRVSVKKILGKGLCRPFPVVWNNSMPLVLWTLVKNNMVYFYCIG